MQNKVLLITGASGFLGSWLADEAVSAGYKIIGIDIHAPIKPQIWFRFATSSLETVDLEELLNDVQLHAVCHLAGGASVASSIKNPFGDFSSLLPGTARLAIHLGKHHPTAKLILFSSAAVYGNPESLPIYETTPAVPISPYGIHKAIAELLLENYSRVYGFNLTVFRIFSVFGPGLRKQLIWDVSQKALAAAAKGQKFITLFGTGNESRDFIYVKDLCKAVIAVASEPDSTPYRILNLASGVESKISHIASSLLRHLHLDLAIEFNGEVPVGDPLNWRADVTRLHDLAYQPAYDMDTALKEVADWVKGIY